MCSVMSRKFRRLSKEKRVIICVFAGAVVLAVVIAVLGILSRQEVVNVESASREVLLSEPEVSSFVESEEVSSSEPEPVESKEAPVYQPETKKEIINLYEENEKETKQIASGGEKGVAPVTPPPSAGRWLSDVPFIDQTKKYPTGCESVSAVMACRYAGISITVETFIDKYLPHAAFEYEEGKEKAIGYHPNRYFMGNPYTNRGFGCYAPCIETAIRGFLPSGYALKNTTGTSLSSLCSQYIDQGIPVIVWATLNMGDPGKGAQWILKENGQIFQWISGEHCLVLTGYDQEYYYFNDPMQGKVKYEKSVVETRYAQMGKQSLVVYPAEPEEDEPEDTLSSEEFETGEDPPDDSSSDVTDETSSADSSETTESSDGQPPVDNTASV